MTPIGLYQLNSLVKQELKNRFPDTFLVIAEIADVKENRSGHCYLELVEKREGDDAVIATARATIWAFTYRMLKPYFETTTGKSLQRGIKVLVSVEIVFHELYGYSLNIKNIDPTFTVGDLERKRKEIIDRLTQEGVIDMNRELELPMLPKTIAVISSPTAAGYGDFTDQLHRNVYGYAFHTKLFPAVMQGEKTTESVIAALERIYEYESLFDVVVIIRGGGSQTDLGSFDSYDLAANVAQFPIPVLAGIGHERDETIVDRVAYRSVKTPTAAAAFLIERFNEAEGRLEIAKENPASGKDYRIKTVHPFIFGGTGKPFDSGFPTCQSCLGIVSGESNELFGTIENTIRGESRGDTDSKPLFSGTGGNQDEIRRSEKYTGEGILYYPCKRESRAGQCSRAGWRYSGNGIV